MFVVIGIVICIVVATVVAVVVVAFRRAPTPENTPIIPYNCVTQKWNTFIFKNKCAGILNPDKIQADQACATSIKQAKTSLLYII